MWVYVPDQNGCILLISENYNSKEIKRKLRVRISVNKGLKCVQYCNKFFSVNHKE